MKIALQYAQNFDGLVLSFPQNDSIAHGGIANEGENSTKLGLKGNPALAEHLQIARDLFLLEYTGGKLHIPTISTKKSIELIAEAKEKGLQVTCSVAVHNLLLSDEELHGYGLWLDRVFHPRFRPDVGQDLNLPGRPGREDYDTRRCSRVRTPPRICREYQKPQSQVGTGLLACPFF